MFSPGSRGRLTDRDLGRFPDDTLFHRLARTVCHAGCLPRKELYEAWETARRVRRLFRGGRVVDLAADTACSRTSCCCSTIRRPGALVVDTALPPSSARLHDALSGLAEAGRARDVRRRPVDDVDILPADIVVSSHACGALTDRVLDRAAAARARVAVLPCCHDLAACDRRLVGLDRRAARDRYRARHAPRSSRAIASGRRRFPPASRRRTVCCWAHRQVVGRSVC